MPKNIIPRDIFPKIEEVREIENEIPTYEEFLKNYKGDELTERSYLDEHEAKINNGPQYGPGRSDFSDLCRRIKNDLGGDLTCRISCNSDSFYSWKNYAGVIVYAVNGNFRWVFSGGRASGRNSRSFYIIIKCTDDLGSDRIGIGGGLFHGSIIKDEIGVDISYNNNSVCCGGFAWVNGELKFKSYALNSVDQIGCSSDGSNEMSYYEKRLVEHCFNEYKRLGPGSVISIPSYYLP